MANLLHTRSNMYTTMNWWLDQYMLAFLKMYYWPAFVAGSADNVVDLFKPQTYSICKA